jgi:hypothetical protein
MQMAASEMRDVDPGTASSTSSGSASGCHSGCSLRADDDLRRQRVAACLAMLSAPASASAPRPSIRSAARIYNLPKSTVHRLLQQTRGGSPTKRRRARPAFAASLAVAKARPCQSNQQRPPKKSAIDFILSPEPAGVQRQASMGARPVFVPQNVLQPPSIADNLAPKFPRPVMAHGNSWEERVTVKDTHASFLEPFPEPVLTPRFMPQGYYSNAGSQCEDHSLHHQDEIVSTGARDCKTAAAAAVMYRPRLAGNQLPSQYSSVDMSKVTGVQESGKASLPEYEPLQAGQGLASKNRILSAVHAEETSPAPRAPSHILDPAWTLISLMERTTPRCQS